jgi:hypothetical protein
MPELGDSASVGVIVAARAALAAIAVHPITAAPTAAMTTTALQTLIVTPRMHCTE